MIHRALLGRPAMGLAMLLAGCSVPGGRAASPTAAAVRVRQAFHLEVPFPPTPVRRDDGVRVVYELHLTNFARTPLEPTRIQVLDAESGAVLHQLEGQALGAALAPVGSTAAARTDRVIAPGMRALLYLELPLARMPRRLSHRIVYLARDETAELDTVDGGEASISSRPAPRLGPPLRGGPWVAVYDPAIERGHRRVVYAVEGRARIPGRFAVDWIRPPATDSDSSAGGGQLRPDGLGAEVLAVADAIVAAARDGVPEPDSGQRPARVALADAAGNYIVLDLGGGRYAFYEHLTPGLLVRAGDRVRRGQVIGRLGATGEALVPHLHFHVADGVSNLGAEGLPYVLEGLQVLGSYPSIEAFARGGAWADPAPLATRPQAFFPSPNLVVRFPG